MSKYMNYKSLKKKKKKRMTLSKVSSLAPDNLLQRADTPQMFAALIGNERLRIDTC